MSTTEGFQDASPGSLNIPLISPRYQTLVTGEVQPFAPPITSLLAPPPGQLASVGSRPFQDPAQQKATAGRIQSVYESLQGFYERDAPELQKIGEPSIQLPLSTARSDMARLNDELLVLSRNPGLESNLTSEDVDGVEANLGYLQKKWRMSVNANSGSPMEGFTVEGFQTYTCPGTMGQNGLPYVLKGNGMCEEQCPSVGYTFIAGTGPGQPPNMCKNNASAVTMILGTVTAISSSSGTASGTGSGSLGSAYVPSTGTMGTGMGTGTMGTGTMGTGTMGTGTMGMGGMGTGTMGTGTMGTGIMGTGTMGTGTMGTGTMGTGTMGTGTMGMGGMGTGTMGTGTMGMGTGTGTMGMGTGTGTMGTMGTGTGTMGTGTGTGSTSAGSDVTLQDLQDLSLKINIEIIRLQSSGAADAFADMNIQSRINVLLSIKKSIDDMIIEIQNGTRLPRNIPFRMADIANFLPAMKNMNTPLPNLIKDAGMNSSINSLFPMFGIGDVSGSVIAREMMHAYGKNFLDNLSWDVAFQYKGKAEQEIAKNNAAAAAGLTHAPAPVPGSSSGSGTGSGSGYRGFFDSIASSMTGGTGKLPANTSGSHARLDWKERSKQICAQIKARGYEPYDFGCFNDPEAMRNESFSWRGYARMVCNRIATIYDPSVPFLCGCPPPTWPGWKQ